MADKLILDCLTGRLMAQDFTAEELRQIEQQKQEQQLNPKVVTEPADADKVAMAEAIVDLNAQIDDLRSQIIKLTGGKE